jgi:hypothetical protein
MILLILQLAAGRIPNEDLVCNNETSVFGEQTVEKTVYDEC